MLCCRPTALLTHRSSLLPHFRLLSTTTIRAKKAEQLPARPTLPDDELHYVFLKGSGPGGQKIVCGIFQLVPSIFSDLKTQNKTSSACQITHLPTGTVVKSQATRSKSQNYTIARRILAEKVELLQKGDESRVVKQAERAAKRKASADKKKRRKYKSLTDAQDDEAGIEEEVPETDHRGGTSVRESSEIGICRNPDDEKI